MDRAGSDAVWVQKVIPMETPTVVELSGDRSVRVTLFDVSDY